MGNARSVQLLGTGSQWFNFNLELQVWSEMLICTEINSIPYLPVRLESDWHHVSSKGYPTAAVFYVT